MEIFVLVLMAVVVGLLIYTIVRLGRDDYTLLANRMADRTRERLQVLRPCPLCGSMLRRGETVHTVVFSGGPRAPGPSGGGNASAAHPSTAPAAGGGRQQDAITHMFGCRYCYPADDSHPRICPVCNRTLSADGYVIARLFQKPGKKHVHVLGCTECRKANSRDTLRSART
ncbi:MAG: hypothetical protein EA382_07650 [Spirochaetaceae bacterium]|nr:MAG: hypothetical protein EA382_07650 [Spirochaetaceae bacterium]